MITAVPADIPVTIPVVAPTLALELVVLHVPPEVGSVSVIVDPSHTTENPPMDDGNGFTLIGVVTVQPVPSE